MSINQPHDYPQHPPAPQPKGAAQSLTIRSAVATLIVSLAALWGIDLDQELVGAVVATGALVVSTGMTVYGRIRADRKIGGGGES